MSLKNLQQPASNFTVEDKRHLCENSLQQNNLRIKERYKHFVIAFLTSNIRA